MVNEFKYYPNIKDEERTINSYKNGGKKCTNDKIVEILRTTAKSIIS